MNKDLEERLKQIKIENYIWVVYIALIIICFISNHYEKNYFLYNDIISKEKYRKLLILIFTIALIVYTYYLYDSYKAYKDLNENDSNKKKQCTKYSLLGSFLIFIAGLIFLIIAINDEDIETELAFN